MPDPNKKEPKGLGNGNRYKYNGLYKRKFNHIGA
jgi:hypothetical protein